MLHYEYIVIDVIVCIALSHKLVFRTINLNKDVVPAIFDEFVSDEFFLSFYIHVCTYLEKVLLL
jgi:hypothetical protein